MVVSYRATQIISTTNVIAVSTSFIVGFTIIFGIAALGIVHAMVEPEFGAVDSIIGLFAFGVGPGLLVVGRAEPFNEKFVATVASAGHLVCGLGLVYSVTSLRRKGTQIRR